ncbi:M23 family metallopeptidase [Bacillus sp. EB600]|uniref:M23 family metallopeptidase n=1 Tax=Bacillus sp. EB600 TaxID=2806345 RepID=UPI00210BF724|nr:M23 family metallopeptidase [Bacillus sp. EB600]MCQ6279912.1 M23 family metallopeptidase [Bacillus sp. EB600]
MREEENKRSSQSSSFKRFMKKRWVFPAIYIASAAIILTAVLWYQTSNNNATDKYDYKSTDIAGKKFNDPAIEVNRTMENFAMPVKDAAQAVVQKKFYDFSGKKADQEAALVVYKNTYVPNTGIDIGMNDGKEFDVVAAMSGKVTKVEEDSLLGNVIEVEHDNGVVTQYESVKDMKVKVGDQIEQGQVIAKAGQSLFNEKAGTHVHFEIRKDGVAVNPQNYFNKPLSALLDDQSATKKSSNVIDNKQKIDDSKSKDQNSTKDKSTNDTNTNDKKTNDTNTNDTKTKSTTPSDSSSTDTNS